MWIRSYSACCGFPLTCSYAPSIFDSPWLIFTDGVLAVPGDIIRTLRSSALTGLPSCHAGRVPSLGTSVSDLFKAGVGAPDAEPGRPL